MSKITHDFWLWREYESDDLASDSEDEKRLRSAENRSLRSIKDKKGPHPYSKYVLSATVTVSRPCATATTPESTFRGVQGRIQNFKLGGALKQIWGISCEKSRFYAKKSYFFQLQREAGKFLRYFI